MINLKTAHEIDLMARAGALLASVLPPLKEACQPGVKTMELDRIADKLIRDGGATPGFLGYHGPAPGYSGLVRRFGQLVRLRVRRAVRRGDDVVVIDG